MCLTLIFETLYRSNLMLWRPLIIFKTLYLSNLMLWRPLIIFKTLTFWSCRFIVLTIRLQNYMDYKINVRWQWISLFIWYFFFHLKIIQNVFFRNGNEQKLELKRKKITKCYKMLLNIEFWRFYLKSSWNIQVTWTTEECSPPENGGNCFR